MVKLFLKLKHWWLERRLKSAVKKADWLAKKSGCTFLVLRYKKGFLIKSKKELKKLIRENYFAKGFDIQTAEKIALYITNR